MGGMTDSGAAARPRQLTMAGWFVVGGSVFLVLSVFDTLAGLDSLDVRDGVARMLASTGEGLGLTVEQALTGMRIGLSVAAVCGAVAAVLGVFVLQRNRGARIGLSVLAVPILITAPLSGGLVGALVVAAIMMLWSGPARDWFAGRPVRETVPLFGRGRGGDNEKAPPQRGMGGGERPPYEPPAPTPTRPEPEERPVPQAGPSTGQPSSQPDASRGFGDAPVQASAYAQPLAPYAEGRVDGTLVTPMGAAWDGPARVPGPVRAACIVTWVFAGMVALMYAAVLAVLALAQDQLVDRVVASPAWEQANLERDVLVPVLWIGGLMFLGWSLSSLVLAWFTWRRHNWARYLLMVSAAVALVAGTFAFPFGALHQVACAVVIGLLLSTPARAWFALARVGWSGPPMGPPGQSGPPSGPAGGAQYPGPQGPPSGGGKPPVW